MNNLTNEIVALDLFAGSGWGVACQRLGIVEYGVEIMPDAIATREANGMRTIYNDVWDGLAGRAEVPAYNLGIASPPCQTFSVAGQGAGRKALDDVLGLIADHAYALPGEGLRSRALELGLDDRTALVLTPLAHAFRDRPKYLAWEQVPAVLPVWEACAEVLRQIGYSVSVGILHAEQYGVPQTRKRAILVASSEREARLPEPTHSKFYNRTPEKMDPGLLPWVSMAEGLGWSPEEAPPGVYVHPVSNARRGVWPSDEPSPTIRGVNRPMPETYNGHDRDACSPGMAHSRLTIEESAALQTYPVGWGFTNRPALTVSNSVGRGLGGGSGARDTVRHAIRDDEFIRSVHAKDDSYAEATRITVDEAAKLQTYDPSPAFIFCGTKTNQFLQIGNAVPPLLAEAILGNLIPNDRESNVNEDFASAT